MTVQTEKEFYIETKHYVYVDYTIRARDKEHALEQFENGSYDDIVDVMFNLLDANQLTQLEDIIVNQYPYPDKDDLFIDINNTGGKY